MDKPARKSVVAQISPILAGIAFALAYWIAVSFIHAYAFGQGDIVTALFRPPSLDLWERLMVAALIVALGVIAHVTARAHAISTRALRVEKDKLGGIVGALGDGVDIISRDYRITFQNELLRKRFGDLTGEICYRRYVGRDAPCEGCPMTRAIATNTTQRAEVTGTDGRHYEVTSIPFVDADGETRAIEIVRDITERKRAEEALRESEERFRGLAESISDVFFAMDRNFRYTYWNKASEELTGVARGKALGKSLYEIFPRFKDTPTDEFYKKVMQTKTPGVFETAFELKGKQYSFELSAYPTEEGLAVFVKDITERKRMENALRESEERYRTLIEQAQEPISVIQDFKHVYVNPAYCTLLGYSSPDELLGKSLEETIAPPDREIVRERYEKRIAGEDVPSSYELRLRQKDGGVIWGEVAVHLRQFRGRPAVQSASHDITKRKLAEQALRESEARYRDLFEHSALPMSRASLSGKIIAANTRFEELTGYSRNELLYKMTIADLVVPELAGEVMEMHRARRATGAPESYETVFLTKDGRRKYVAISTRLIPGTDEDIAVLQDITERRKAEQALRESEERYRTTFENTGTAMAIVEADTTISLANGKFAELSGYSREEIEGKMKWTDFVVREDLDRMLEYHRERRKEGGEAPKQYEFRFVARDGCIKEILLNIDMIPRTSKSVCSLLDITERNVAERALEDSRQQMRDLSARVLSAQEKERTRISREIHDELAQALTALRFDLTSLSKSPPRKKGVLAEKLAEMDDRISETIRTVRRISAELRPGMLDDLGLVSAVEWYLNDFQERTKIGCDLKIKPGDFVLDPGRSTALFRILQEALTNVMRHAGATEVCVSLRKKPDRLLLEVCDNGRGITPEQAASSRSLGLTGMRERARLWQGSVKIEGAKGKGTIISVEIPLDEYHGGGIDR